MNLPLDAFVDFARAVAVPYCGGQKIKKTTLIYISERWMSDGWSARRDMTVEGSAVSERSLQRLTISNSGAKMRFLGALTY